MPLFGYARVSTRDQDLAVQDAELRAALNTLAQPDLPAELDTLFIFWLQGRCARRPPDGENGHPHPPKLGALASPWG
jgi:hypothetical protein